MGFFAEEAAECFVDGGGLGWAVEDGAGFSAVCHGRTMRGGDEESGYRSRGRGEKSCFTSDGGSYNLKRKGERRGEDILVLRCRGRCGAGAGSRARRRASSSLARELSYCTSAKFTSLLAS